MPPGMNWFSELLSGGTTSQLRPYLHGIQVLYMLRLSQGFRHWGFKKPETLRAESAGSVDPVYLSCDEADQPKEGIRWMMKKTWIDKCKEQRCNCYGYKVQTQQLSWIDGAHPRQSNQSN